MLQECVGKLEKAQEMFILKTVEWKKTNHNSFYSKKSC